MKLHVLSNSVDTASGYGKQLKAFIPRIHVNTMHEVVAMASNSTGGSFVRKNSLGIPEYPVIVDQGWNAEFDLHMKRCAADVALTLYDVHILKPDVYAKHKTAMWAPIDCEPLPRGAYAALQSATWIWSMSQFGHRVLRESGFDPIYVPHGVDTSVFRPIDRDKARRWLGEETGKDLNGRYLVVMVAMNKGYPSRKNFFGAFDAFARFRETHPDAFLYVHTDYNPTGNTGEPLVEYASRLGIIEHIAFPQQYKMVLSQYGDEDLNQIYNAADVFFLLSYAEGFGVPIIEAQAAGCPVVVSSGSAMAELVKAGYKIPTFRAQNVIHADSFWRGTSTADAAIGLSKIYEWRDKPEYRAAAADAMREYDFDYVFNQYMQPALDKMASDIQPKAKQTISAVVVWKDHPEYIRDFELAAQGVDELIVIDNGSECDNSRLLMEMVQRRGGIYYKNAENLGFGAGCNKGFALASGDVVIFLNNDIAATQPNWIDRLRVCDGELVGQSLQYRSVNGLTLPYIEGWSIAATRKTWRKIGAWNEDFFAYWEDNELCWRAWRKGIELKQQAWGLIHLGGGTSRDDPETRDRIKANEAKFALMMREDLK